MAAVWFWTCATILAVLWGRGRFAAPKIVRVLHSIRLTATLGLITWLVISALGAWSQPKAEIAIRGLFVWAFVSGGAIAYHAKSAVFGIIFYTFFIGAFVFWSLPPKGEANLLPGAPWSFEGRFGQWIKQEHWGPPVK